MRVFTRESRLAAAYAAIAVWGFLLVACVAVKRTAIAPPQVPGATFVGSKECAQCHEDITRHFDSATHARLQAEGPHATTAIGCEGCHGPGSVHVKTGGNPGTIVNPDKSPQACFQCHTDKRGEFALPHSHPVMHGKITCTDCHEPHRGDAITSGGVALASMNDTCTKCHAAQRGPFVFEHEAAREGCVFCHNPHGSVNDKMLRARNHSLCLQCHFQQQTAAGQLLIGGRDHTSFMSRGTCWSAGCHEAVHGSHVNSSLRF